MGLVARLKEKVKQKADKVATKVTSRFRNGDHEKGVIGGATGAVLLALGGTGYLGNTIQNMVSSMTGSSSSGSSNGPNYAAFVNDILVLVGIVSVVLGLMAYRRYSLKKLLKD